MRTWLSPAGAAAAALVGATVAFGAGWQGLVVLLVFFLSGSLLTPGGGRRRAVQVLANGGVAAACALVGRSHASFLIAFGGAIAAAAADTWSTEIGARSRSVPRLITSGRPVAPGTSGGVTLLGTAGGGLGALAIGLACLLVGLVPASRAAWIAAAGFAGALADSALGATLQVRYRCAGCGLLTEDPRHGCAQGPALTHGSGLPGMTNDAVNLLATLTGAALALAPAVLGGKRLP